MSAKHVIEAIGINPVTVEGLQLRLSVAGYSLPNLQNILDGLLMVGMVKRSNTADKVWYELTNPPKWEPADACVEPQTLPKNLDRKLADLEKHPLPFYITEAAAKKRRAPRPNLDNEILAVIQHDGPSTVKILDRLKNTLRLRPEDISFMEVKIKLNEMKEKGLVGVLKATETTAGGWIIPRKPRMKF